VRPFRHGLPDDAEQLIEGYISHWSRLDLGEQDRLLALTDWLLRRKHWEAARAFRLDDTMRVVIAAQAALLVLGLSTDHYRSVSAVVVHPSTTALRGERAGPIPGTVTDAIVPVHGLAQSRRGPVVIAWDQALAGARHPERGHNVVFHEFAHKLDMLDGTADGAPPLPRAEFRRWEQVCTEVFDSLRAGRARPPLRPYGAVDRAEFFAVATEAFFDRPVDLEAHEPALYGVLADFYRQDPARRDRSSADDTVAGRRSRGRIR
jgi:Mlc titration factor MtfA (ptsG expression regulator)